MEEIPRRVGREGVVHLDADGDEEKVFVFGFAVIASCFDSGFLLADPNDHGVVTRIAAKIGRAITAVVCRGHDNRGRLGEVPMGEDNIVNAGGHMVDRQQDGSVWSCFGFKENRPSSACVTETSCNLHVGKFRV